MLENAILMDKSNEIKKFRKATLRSGKVVLSYTRKKLATERTESFKLMGIYCWLINKPKMALTWWDQSIREGLRLSEKIEVSRTYFEIGKSLLEPSSKTKALNNGWYKTVLNISNKNPIILWQINSSLGPRSTS